MASTNDLKALAQSLPADLRERVLIELDAAPRVPAQRVQAAALVFSNRTGELHLMPVLAFDFYPKEPA